MKIESKLKTPGISSGDEKSLIKQLDHNVNEIRKLNAITFIV
jgi:hypothetical protein